jgi:hypothetical protein
MKYFSHSYLNDYNILGKARIGLEFEFLSKINYHSTIYTLSNKLGIDIKGVKEYHSDFVPTEKEWKLEPDFSGGFSCAELITHPMSYSESRVMISKICKVLQEIGETTDRTGIHINISFEGDSRDQIEGLNPIKLILNIDEEKIYDVFPDRKNNVYCKSVKNLIPYKNYDFSFATSRLMSSSLALGSEMSKYYGINFSCLKDGRIEFRYIGGEDYQYKSDEILDLMDYFIISTYNSLHSQLSAGEQKMLRRYLEQNISKYKSLSKIESFYTKYPTVSLQVDCRDEFELVKSYYPTFFDELFNVVSTCDNLEDCIINFDTDTRQLEVVNADVVCKGLMDSIVFIETTIKGGDFNSCEFLSCRTKDAIFNSSKFEQSEVTDSKLFECNVLDETLLTECFFSEGVLDGQMQGGVFRSGKITENAEISKETKMINDDQNFFGFKGIGQSGNIVDKFSKGKK